MDEAFIDDCFRRFLGRPADAAGLAYYLDRLQHGASPLDVVQGIVVSQEFFTRLMRPEFLPQVGMPFLSFAPPGHYYSPIPEPEAVAARAAQELETEDVPAACPGIDLDVEGQLALVRMLSPFVRDLEFDDERGARTRFFWENDGFAPGDAVWLIGMLRHFRPARIIEVGAGYSTAVMLDTIERYLWPASGPHRRLDCIDPDPMRLRSLLRGNEADWLAIQPARVQDLPLSFFSSLQPNDVLFIDSSHVLKLGSDVEFLFLEVLPSLTADVIVHFHDIAWPFVYPAAWYEEGRAWNESQVLRTFLIFNVGYRILLFPDYLFRFHQPFLQQHAPLALRQPRSLARGNAAVSFWMRRT